jgi:hypothetical protein
VLLSYNLHPVSGFLKIVKEPATGLMKETIKEWMDQGRFFDQFFGIVFGTVVVVSQDWFF